MKNGRSFLLVFGRCIGRVVRCDNLAALQFLLPFFQLVPFALGGQVGLGRDGDLPDDVEKQIHIAFDNVFAVLAEADMDAGDVVRLNIYLTDAGDVAAYRKIRDERMEGRLTASTLVVVSALVDPRMKVEIEAVAAEMSSPGRTA